MTSAQGVKDTPQYQWQGERKPVSRKTVRLGRAGTWLNVVLKIKDSSSYNSMSCTDFCENLSDGVEETKLSTKKQMNSDLIGNVVLKYESFSVSTDFDKDWVSKPPFFSTVTVTLTCKVLQIHWCSLDVNLRSNNMTWLMKLPAQTFNFPCWAVIHGVDWSRSLDLNQAFNFLVCCLTYKCSFLCRWYCDILLCFCTNVDFLKKPFTNFQKTWGLPEMRTTLNFSIIRLLLIILLLQ